MELGANTPTIKTEARKKRWLLMVGIIIICLLAVYLIWSYIISPRLPVMSMDKAESARKIVDQNIYTVEELSQKFKSDPNYFKNKEVKVNAVGGNGVLGMGCDDYSIASDAISSNQLLNTNPQLSYKTTIAAYRIGEYGTYTGHFYDKYWVKKCDDPGMFVTTSFNKIDLNLPSLNKKETVQNGYMIFEGKLLKRPYEIAIEGNNITINGITYETMDGNYPNKNSLLESTFSRLLTDMQQGYLYIIINKIGNSKASSIYSDKGSPKPEEIVNNLDKIINSNLSDNDKKINIKEILGNIATDKYLNDFLINWNS